MLYDPSEQETSSHNNLNCLRVKLSTKKDKRQNCRHVKLVSIYFKCSIASELLEGLICSRPINCACSQGSLPCTELFTCHGHDSCGNPHSLDTDQDGDNEESESEHQQIVETECIW